MVVKAEDVEAWNLRAAFAVGLLVVRVEVEDFVVSHLEGVAKRPRDAGVEDVAGL